jgi:hypothetical protein
MCFYKIGSMISTFLYQINLYSKPIFISLRISMCIPQPVYMSVCRYQPITAPMHTSLSMSLYIPKSLCLTPVSNPISSLHRYSYIFKVIFLNLSNASSPSHSHPYLYSYSSWIYPYSLSYIFIVYSSGTIP